MTPEEKLDQRISTWLTTEGKTFASGELAAAYQRRGQRILDAIRLKQPDRVPNIFLGGGCMVTYGGATLAGTFYNG